MPPHPHSPSRATPASLLALAALSALLGQGARSQQPPGEPRATPRATPLATTPSQPAAAAPTLHLAARILPADGEPIDGGAMLVGAGKILAIGSRSQVKAPPGAVTVDHGSNWLAPGFVDLHHHVSGGGGDINDMTMPLNAEMRTLDVVKPNDEAIVQTVAGGVTTTLFIPGSGTNIGGFGTLLKMVPGGSLQRMVVRELGAMKVAQGFNPERGSGDLGASRMGSSALLTQLLERGQAYAKAWREFRAQGESRGPAPKFDPTLEQLRKVFDLEVPVLIHTAGARDCIATSRMFQDVFNVRMILSHGCFDGWLAAAALSKRKTPLNLGPRMFEFDRYGRIQGMCQAYWDAGCRDISINTDAPVVAAEQLQLQAAMAHRLGLPYAAALCALTIQPARQIGLHDRIGSLAVGKDADFQVTAGDPLDPRHAPSEVWIDGQKVYQLGDCR